MRRATAKMVAERAGVSRSLVSMYLAGNPKTWISAATKQRIDEAVKALNYRPNPAGQALRGGRTGTAVLILGGMTSPGGGLFAETLLEAFEERGVRLYLSVTKFDPARERAALTDALRLDYDAVIDSLSPDFVREELREVPPDFPLFFTTEPVPGSPFGAVWFDRHPALEELRRRRPGKTIALWSNGFDGMPPDGWIVCHHTEWDKAAAIRPDVLVLSSGISEAAFAPEWKRRIPDYVPEFVACGFRPDSACCVELDLPAFAAELAAAVVQKINSPESEAIRRGVPAILKEGERKNG